MYDVDRNNWLKFKGMGKKENIFSNSEIKSGFKQFYDKYQKSYNVYSKGMDGLAKSKNL